MDEPSLHPERDATQDIRLSFVQETVKEIKDVVNDISCNINNFKLNYTQEHQKLVSAGEDTQRRIIKHDEDIKSLRDEVSKLTSSIAPLIFANKILTWVSIAVGGSVFALIWSLIIGRVHLILP